VGTQDSAGPAILVFRLLAIVFAIWNLRQRVVGVLTIVVATVVSSYCAWAVLFDTHSTAAIGIPWPGIYAIAIVAAGIVLEAGVRRLTSH
jgi:lipopolysaccharide export LptBFGC system permease protein LptF